MDNEMKMIINKFNKKKSIGQFSLCLGTFNCFMLDERETMMIKNDKDKDK